ncbi:unnamed protein product [Brachionus calyciflorus]|uniref:Uncharacterized protein n=1 Tax=Brachionus calyciflorus TaxID=104777 RepID=A0A814L7C6_9BILA|nr:unnamed protein product [Brachionus calyciflorus]
MENDIFDIYVTNISIVWSEYFNRNISTQDALWRFINNFILFKPILERIGLVDLIKIRKYCESHDAVEIIDSLMNFRGRKLIAKLNDIRLEDGQWFRSNNRLKLFDNQRLYYHEEKTKYIKKQNDGRESITIKGLRAELAAEKLGRKEGQLQLVNVKEKLSKANRLIEELLEQNERFQSAENKIKIANNKMAKQLEKKEWYNR